MCVPQLKKAANVRGLTAFPLLIVVLENNEELNEIDFVFNFNLRVAVVFNKCTKSRGGGPRPKLRDPAPEAPRQELWFEIRNDLARNAIVTTAPRS